MATLFKSAASGIAAMTVAVTVAAAQDTQHSDNARQSKNPFAGRKDVVEATASQYRIRCANCHGADARGFRGPDLTTGRFGDPSGEERLFRVLKEGVPGTEMPGMGIDDSIWRMVTYVQSLNAPAITGSATRPLTGNAARGEQIFWGAGGCGACHVVRGRGNHFGPELTRGFQIASVVAREALVSDIRQASQRIRDGFSTVTVVLNDATPISGIKKAEDVFSIQMLDPNRRLRAFLKSDVREVRDESRSLMPDYTRLPETDLDDLVAYLHDLSQTATARAPR